MAGKNDVKLFSASSLLVFLKSVATNVLAALVFVPLVIVVALVAEDAVILGGVFALALFVLYCFLWGFLSRKLWGWD